MYVYSKLEQTIDDKTKNCKTLKNAISFGDLIQQSALRQIGHVQNEFLILWLDTRTKMSHIKENIAGLCRNVRLETVQVIDQLNTPDTGLWH